MIRQDTRPFALVGMSQAERKILLDLVRQEAPDLLHPGAVKRIRRGTWDLIARKFNESTTLTRSVAQLKSCLQNIMRKTLQKKAGASTSQQSFRKINFTAFEKDVILNLGKHQPVVFSKLKDGKTQAAKRKAWTAMMWAFNRTPGIKTQRTAREIKNCLVNMTNRSREVDEFLKSQMPEYEGHSNFTEQPHLEGTVVLGGVPHPVTNVHGNNVTQKTMQSPTSSMQSGGSMVNNKSQQNRQSIKPQVSKHRFLLPKPPGAQSASLPNPSTPVLISAVPQNTPTPHSIIPQNNRPTVTHPVRTISVPQVSMASSQLSPPVSTPQTHPSQTPMPQLVQSGSALQMHSSPVQTISSPNMQSLQPASAHHSQSHSFPLAQNSVLNSSGWIPNTPPPPTLSSKLATGDTLSEPEDGCIIEIKEESSSDSEELYMLEQQSSTTPMEIRQSPIESSRLQRYGDQLMNSAGISHLEKIHPAKATTPQSAEELSNEPDGLRNVHIQVHRDGVMSHADPSMMTGGTGEISRRMGQHQATSISSLSYTSSHPTEQNHQQNSSGYLIQTSSQFPSQSELLPQDSSCSTTELPTDHSNEMQDSGIRRSEPSGNTDSSRRARLKRRKESVGTMKKRLLQREHDLRVEMMREEHAWMLEEHVWRREEHELRMNMIRINSKFS